jgi:hypothetical protein
MLTRRQVNQRKPDDCCKDGRECHRYADVTVGIVAEYRKLGKSSPSGSAAEPTT